MKNYLTFLEYDGKDFYGWQKQKKQITVQGTLEKALKKIFKEDIKVIGQGRIDRGAHALSQTANFFAPYSIPPKNLKEGTNSLLPSSIRVKKITEVPLNFHARFSAVSRVYMYLLLVGEEMPVFLRNYVASCKFNLNTNKMMEASKYLIGKHDFSSFSSGEKRINKVREIYRIEIEKKRRILLPWIKYKGNIIKIEIEANSFLRHMVRSIAGILVEVGRGKITPRKVIEIFNSKGNIGITLPSCGLFLKKVKYPEFYSILQK